MYKQPSHIDKHTIDKELSWDITRQFTDEIISVGDRQSGHPSKRSHHFSFKIGDSVPGPIEQRTPVSLQHIQKKTKTITDMRAANKSVATPHGLINQQSTCNSGQWRQT